MDHQFSPPGARLDLVAPDDLVALAERLWVRTPAASGPTGGEASPIRLTLGVREGVGEPPPRAAALERSMVWELEEGRIELRVPGFLGVAMDVPGRRAEGWVTADVAESEPSLVARLLLEIPAGVLMSRHRHAVLHAGAVLGPRGAVVIRGPSGAGKSTLVGAALGAGLAVLGDESLLALREDPDELSASVRELTLTRRSAELLGIAGEPTFSGGEEKRRVDLFGSGSPRERSGRRAATLLLGPRTPGPARLTALSAANVLAGFAEGAVAQETGDAFSIASAWGRSNAYRLEGFEDLASAVALLRSLLGA